MKAVLKDASILLPRGFRLKVVSFPGGKDPDELLHKSGPEAVRGAVDSAVDFFDFLFRYASAGLDPNSPDGKIRIASLMLQYIRMLDSDVAQDSYLNWLGEKLNLSPEALAQEMKKQAAGQHHAPLRERPPERAVSETGKRKTGPLPASMTDPQLKVALTELLRNILHYPSCAEKAAKELSPDYLDDGPLPQAITVLLQAYLDKEPDQGPARITRALAVSSLDCSDVFTLLTEEIPSAPSDEIPLKIVSDCLLSIRRKHLQQQIFEVRRLLNQTPAGEERQDLLREFIALTKSLAETGKKGMGNDIAATV